ncbi:MAG: flavin monoamine oxidase family protein [Gemmatimonadota bacterium]
MTETNPEVLDVAIVGGGVSGVYSGWRLLTASAESGATPKHIRLFEMSDRLGGRLLSVRPPGTPDLSVELGGMRYMSSQTYMNSLVHYLEMPIQCFPVDEPNNIYYLRGERLRASELADPAKVPYQLTWAEWVAVKNGGAGQLLFQVLNQLLAGATQLQTKAMETFLREFVFEGKRLHEWGFWNLLSKGLSSEGRRFAQQTVGYDTAFWNWNALDTILMNFDFAPDAKYFSFPDGFEGLPEKLGSLFTEAGGQLHLEHRLKSFDVASLPDGSVGVSLMMCAKEPDGSWGAPQEILARSLVLSMPRRSLELIDQTGAVLGPDNPDVHEMIGSVTPNPLFKMVLAYPYPWWEGVGVKQGHSITDLPVRQCYYWGVEGEGETGANRCQNAVLEIYDDGVNVDFWRGFQESHEPHEDADRQLYLHAEDGVDPRCDEFPGSKNWEPYEAPKAMVDEAHRQIMDMHGAAYAPAPYAAAFKVWRDDPYGGGVNFWNIHADSYAIVPKIVNPKPNVPVYITGEAYSHGQGWVEGALETAEIVLQDHFGLRAPGWIIAFDPNDPSQNPCKQNES